MKAFCEKPSPFTLNGESISEKAFTFDVKIYSTIYQIFFYPKLAKQQPERRGDLGGGGNDKR